MKKNDYFVIVYRILAYLYECMKNGERASLDYLKYNTDQFPINQIYWSSIWENLIDEVYVKGAVMVPITGGFAGVKIGVNVRIAPSGIQYLMENSAFEKVKTFLKDLKEIVPGL